MKQIIVLSGFAGAGKDTVGEILVQNHGFTQTAFADKLRAALYVLNPDVVNVQTGVSTLQNIIDEYGWQGYKDTIWHEPVRGLMQRMGTEVGRDTLHPDTWINAVINDLPSDKVVITDGRFSNEFNAVLHHGGEVWRVNRPGITAQSDHPSETEAVKYKHFNKVIENAGTISDLTKIVARAYSDFEEKYRSTPAPKQTGDGLSSRPQNPGGLAPRKGDGSVTSVNVPKARSRM